MHESVSKTTSIHDSLNEIAVLLNGLESDLKNMENMWMPIEKESPDPLFEKHWQQREARCWLHGSTDFFESQELEQWKIAPLALSDLAKTNARECIEHWREWLDQEDAYYEPFEMFTFPNPARDESLIDFLKKMAIPMQQQELPPLGQRAFKSFLAYARKLAHEEWAFIEHIFPQDMRIEHDMITRKVSLESYPIPQETAAEIVKALAKQCCQGRKDARITSAEGLGLVWMCLATSKLRLPVLIKNMLHIKRATLNSERTDPQLAIPTLFGIKNVRISKRIARFLQILSSIPSSKPRTTLLQRPTRTLNGLLKTVMADVSPDSKFGNITYSSLLAPPHGFGQHRYQSK